MTDEDLQEIRRNLVAAMDELRLTQAELATKAKLSESAVSQFLSDSQRGMRRTTLQKYERAVGRKLLSRSVVASAGQAPPSPIQLSGEETPKMADAIHLRVLEQISLSYEGTELRLAIKNKRYGREPVAPDAEDVFVVSLPEDAGPFKAKMRLTVSTHMEPEEDEHVLVVARGRRQFGTYGLDDERRPSVTLWAGGVTRDFKRIGTVVEATFSTLRRPR